MSGIVPLHPHQDTRPCDSEAPEPATVPLDRQIACVGRELGMRRGVYPKWVTAGRMTPAKAAEEIAAMAAVYDTLKRLQAAR